MTTGDEKIDLAALRRLARAATPGPWKAEFHRSMPGTPVRMYWINANTSLGAEREETAHYIAAASPDVILALLDRVEAAERDAARYRHLREHDGPGGVVSDDGR